MDEGGVASVRPLTPRRRREETTTRLDAWVVPVTVGKVARELRPIRCGRILWDGGRLTRSKVMALAG
jgi:hypothetical protein